MSGAAMRDGGEASKGAVDAILAHVGAAETADLERIVERIARSGGTPLVVSRDRTILGVVHLKDTVRPGLRAHFDQLRQIGIRTIMVTGDNALTAATIAAEAGVDDFVAQASPEAKLRLIRDEQAKGSLVAMCGDGTNDAPALAQADVGVAMNLGTTAAREAGNMIDLDSDPMKLMEVIRGAKNLLMTRQALTMFSTASDVAKYFVILPAMFVVAYPEPNVLDIMNLASPESAILSAIIFDAIMIDGVDSARVARGALCIRHDSSSPAPQPAGLRCGRADRAVRRHQGRRSGDHRAWLGLSERRCDPYRK